MESHSRKSITGIHIVAVPYPGRGQINAMVSLCKLLALRQPDILITFVVTEEWLGIIGSDTKSDNVQFATIPNVIPSQKLVAVDIRGFNEAVLTKMEAPFEKLVDRLDPVAAMIGDVEMCWLIDVGNRRDIPVASLWTMSATIFVMLYRTNISVKLRQLPSNWFDNVNEEVDQISGLSSTQKADLQKVFQESDKRVVQISMECISKLSKTQYLLFTSFFEYEPQIIETLKQEFSFPVYMIGPTIPYFELQAGNNHGYNYQQWLDSQPADSVLYISLGSFLSVSASQMDEIASGLRNSGVRFLWVARGEADRLKESCGEKGMVVSWCDQLKVLCHSSVGGFLSHCGWNSTMEAVFAGVPLLAFPLFFDQHPNSTRIVEDWKIGWRVKRTKVGTETLVVKEEISELVQRFMDFNNSEGKKMRDKTKKLKEICHRTIGEGGSSYKDLDGFIRSISPSESK